ncbi:ABC transporter ATP-binding protein [Bordetella pertussis]|nr:ABC transporter ATP-binding protein [Bordetella pertussis]
MRQRVVIALALSCGPEVIIADEPTTALDVSIQAQILDLLRKLCREKQVGMIIITHDMGVIADVTDRVAVLYRGKLVEQGPTAKILGNPDHPYTRSLISAVPRPDVKLRRFPVVTYIEDVKRPTVELDIATHWLGQRREFARRAAGPLVEVEDLGMRFVLRNAFLARNRRTLDAVKQVNLSINEGEVFGLVGESGSGKSTVARLIAGLYTPTNGRVLFNGVDLTGLKDEKRMNAFRRQIQMVFQDPYSSLNPRMRVQEIVAEPIRFHRLAEGEAQTRRVVADLLDVVGLGASAAQRYPHEFSGGQRQRICIARAGHPAALPDLRRTDLGAGRVDPGADSESAQGSAGTAGPDHAFHQP